VPAGGVANAFVVSARVGGAVDDAAGVGVFLVSPGQPGVELQPYPMQDGSSGADLVLNEAAAIELIAPGAAFAALERAVDVGIAALCAEAVGAMDRLVALTVEYMNTRKQFGVAIATFQALRHRIADVKMQLELGRSMSYFASLKLGEPAEARRRALSQAKVQLGQSMRFLGQQSVQMHGGIGVTDEYAGSHYFKRLTVIEMTFGDTMFHLGEVSRRMQTTAGVFA
jgi:alkylation response protein AidB-like acyl-CoA dehydrogenase